MSEAIPVLGEDGQTYTLSLIDGVYQCSHPHFLRMWFGTHEKRALQELKRWGFRRQRKRRALNP